MLLFIALLFFAVKVSKQCKPVWLFVASYVLEWVSDFFGKMNWVAYAGVIEKLAILCIAVFAVLLVKGYVLADWGEKQ